MRLERFECRIGGPRLVSVAQLSWLRDEQGRLPRERDISSGEQQRHLGAVRNPHQPTVTAALAAQRTEDDSIDVRSPDLEMVHENLGGCPTLDVEP